MSHPDDPRLTVILEYLFAGGLLLGAACLHNDTDISPISPVLNLQQNRCDLRLARLLKAYGDCSENSTKKNDKEEIGVQNLRNADFSFGNTIRRTRIRIWYYCRDVGSMVALKIGAQMVILFTDHVMVSKQRKHQGYQGFTENSWCKKFQFAVMTQTIYNNLQNKS